MNRRSFVRSLSAMAAGLPFVGKLEVLGVTTTTSDTGGATVVSDGGGLLTVNDVRRLYDLPPIECGTSPFIGIVKFPADYAGGIEWVA